MNLRTISQYSYFGVVKEKEKKIHIQPYSHTHTPPCLHAEDAFDAVF
jgi:hypothetical protein